MLDTKRIPTLIFTLSFVISLLACSSPNLISSGEEAAGSETELAESDDASELATEDTVSESDAATSTDTDEDSSSWTSTVTTTSSILETKTDFAEEVSEIADYSVESRTTILTHTTELRANLIASELDTAELASALESLDRLDSLVKATPMTMSGSLPFTKTLDGIAKTLETSGLEKSTAATKVESLRDSLQAADAATLIAEITDQIEAVKKKAEALLGTDALSVTASLDDLLTAATAVKKTETLLTIQNQVLTMADLIAEKGATGVIKAGKIAAAETLKISERSKRETLLATTREAKETLAELEASGTDITTTSKRTKLLLSVLADGSADEVNIAGLSLATSLKKSASATTDETAAAKLSAAADSILELIGD